MKRKIVDWIAGRKLLQPLFETLYRAGTYGMNFGNGGDFRKSGERFVAGYVRDSFKAETGILNIFDVGANKGNYSKEIIEYFTGTAFRLYAFEPSKATFKVLVETIGNRENVILNNIGLGEKSETLKLHSRGPLSGLSSVYKRRLDHFGIDMSMNEDIEIHTLDYYCEKQKIEHIHFLKMDIEGHEYKCLLGAESTLLKKNISFIQFEFGGCNIDSRTYFQDYWYLLHDNYHIYRIVKDGLVKIEKYNERLEIFKNINYLAVLKSIG